MPFQNKFKCRVTRVNDPINFEVIVELGLDIMHRCKIKLHGVKYHKYDASDRDSEEYTKFLSLKEFVKSRLLGKESMIEFESDNFTKDKAGKFLVKMYELDDHEESINEKLVKSGALERFE